VDYPRVADYIPKILGLKRGASLITIISKVGRERERKIEVYYTTSHFGFIARRKKPPPERSRRKGGCSAYLPGGFPGEGGRG